MALLRRGFGWILAALLLGQAAHGQSIEYKLKAAYLCRFVDFVEWPPEAFATTNSPLVIGVLGDDPFGPALDEVALGQTSRGHPLVVRRFASVKDIGPCHVLFISASETPRVGEIMRDLEGREILTVSEINNFALRGGVVRFFTQNNKVRFRINMEAAKAGKLSISSRLLQLADVVKDAPVAP